MVISLGQEGARYDPELYRATWLDDDESRGKEAVAGGRPDHGGLRGNLDFILQMTGSQERGCLTLCFPRKLKKNRSPNL